MNIEHTPLNMHIFSKSWPFWNGGIKPNNVGFQLKITFFFKTFGTLVYKVGIINLSKLNSENELIHTSTKRDDGVSSSLFIVLNALRKEDVKHK